MPYLVTANEMRNLDQKTIHDIGIPGMVLMETAGRSVAQKCLDIITNSQNCNNILILCGPGNNGGDGYVIARSLLAINYNVTLLMTSNPDQLNNDAKTSFDILENCKYATQILRTNNEEHMRYLPHIVSSSDLIVDALLGTGISKNVSGDIGHVISTINSCAQCPIIAVDFPSGLNADNGQIMGEAIAADYTVTFASAKPGHFIHPGCELCGELLITDIGIPEHLFSEQSISGSWLSSSEAHELLPIRSPDAHKGDFGHVLVIGGSPGKAGAASLTALGSLRCGAGLVSVLTAEEYFRFMPQLPAEVMTHPITSFSTNNPSELDTMVSDKHVIACGMGWGTSPSRAKWLKHFIAQTKNPLVLDADALNILAKETSLLNNIAADTVMTPHPGEASRLLQCSIDDIQQDRITAAQKLASLTNTIVLLKGAGSIVANPQGNYSIIPTGNPALAKGGSGDVLTGIIAAFIAQGLDLFHAAQIGSFYHGLSADLLAAKKHQATIVASEIAANLSDAFMQE